MYLKARMTNKTRAVLMGATCLFAAAVTLPTPAVAGDPIFRVDLNKTQVLPLPASAGAVIIGNPNIADVTVHSSSLLLIVGRGFGETNLVVLDQQGNTMVDADIQVTSLISDHSVRLFKASARETYSCAPYCQPSPVLGDSSDFVATNSVESQPLTSSGSVFEQTASALSGANAGGIAGAPPPPGSFDE